MEENLYNKVLTAISKSIERNTCDEAIFQEVKSLTSDALYCSEFNDYLGMKENFNKYNNPRRLVVEFDCIVRDNSVIKGASEIKRLIYKKLK